MQVEVDLRFYLSQTVSVIGHHHLWPVTILDSCKDLAASQIQKWARKSSVLLQGCQISIFTEKVSWYLLRVILKKIINYRKEEFIWQWCMQYELQNPDIWNWNIMWESLSMEMVLYASLISIVRISLTRCVWAIFELLKHQKRR